MIPRSFSAAKWVHHRVLSGTLKEPCWGDQELATSVQAPYSLVGCVHSLVSLLWCDLTIVDHHGCQFGGKGA